MGLPDAPGVKGEIAKAAYLGTHMEYTLATDVAELFVVDRDVANPKPDPEAILLACRQLGVAPREAVMIGDHRRDIDAGHGAGTVTVAAAYGYLDAGEDAAQWNAHHCIASAGQLHDLLF